MDRPAVAILSIGNELLRGDVENSNARWLAQRITSRGARVLHVAIVRDEVEHIGREVRNSLIYGPTLLVTTGGLGPTADDLTLRGIARAARRELELNESALEMLRGRYDDLARAGAVRSAELTASRRKMAQLPRGATPLANRVGTAPGVLLELAAVTIVCLPGVPHEMRHIVETSLAPVLDRLLGPGVQRDTVRFAATTDESSLADALEAVAARHPRIYLKSHAAGTSVPGKFRITLSTVAGSGAEADAWLAAADSDLRATLHTTGIAIEREPAHRSPPDRDARGENHA